MKIRCGSHQQNRSIVRPGLSLMAAKVALTAEEFRENSQRSIALFNTEKLSTNSTHVLKSAYCNSVHFCRCNLHGACGGKAQMPCRGRGCRTVAICTERVEAKQKSANLINCQSGCNLHGACGGKELRRLEQRSGLWLQSARSVWRQSQSRRFRRRCPRCNLHGACGGKERRRREIRVIRGGCNLHGACGGKDCVKPVSDTLYRCNLHGACGGKGALQFHPYY